jgi:hypothetical protein
MDSFLGKADLFLAAKIENIIKPGSRRLPNQRNVVCAIRPAFQIP